MSELNKAFRVDILFPDKFQDMIAEIYYQNEFICLVSQEKGFNFLDIEIVRNSKDTHWKFNLADFETAIEYAKRRLWELRKTE